MCIVTAKTMTQAQKGKRALSMQKIEAEIVSLDKNLTQNGCAYGVSFPCRFGPAVERILKDSGVAYGEVIGKNG